MRPQFHHIDAQTRQSRDRERSTATMPDSARSHEPRMVQQTARTAGAEDEELNIAKTAAFLSAASEEQWTRLEYRDEESDEAFEAYREELFLEDKEQGRRLKAALGKEDWWDGIGSVVFDAPSKLGKKQAAGTAQGKKRAPPDVVMIDD